MYLLELSINVKNVQILELINTLGTILRKTNRIFKDILNHQFKKCTIQYFPFLSCSTIQSSAFYRPNLSLPMLSPKRETFDRKDKKLGLEFEKSLSLQIMYKLLQIKYHKLIEVFEFIYFYYNIELSRCKF